MTRRTPTREYIRHIQDGAGNALDVWVTATGSIRISGNATLTPTLVDNAIAELTELRQLLDPPLVQTAPARPSARPIYMYEPIPSTELPEYIEWGPEVHDPAMFGTVSYGRPPSPADTALHPPERGCPWMALTWDITGKTRYYQLAE